MCKGNASSGRTAILSTSRASTTDYTSVTLQINICWPTLQQILQISIFYLTNKQNYNVYSFNGGERDIL